MARKVALSPLARPLHAYVGDACVVVLDLYRHIRCALIAESSKSLHNNEQKLIESHLSY